jgi:HlyD family type I secretion membrane fusion protein
MSIRKFGEDETFPVAGRIATGLGLAVLLIVGCGGWAAMAEINGAVVASGRIKVDEDLKAVQHRDGGIIKEIAVRKGATVAAGAVMIRLDDVQTKAELSIVRAQIAELAARRARLASERDGLAAIVLPANGSVTEADLATLGETRLFEGNRLYRDSQKEQLSYEIAQLGEEVRGFEAQRAAKLKDFDLVATEHGKVGSLVDKKLLETARLYASERELARLQGEIAEIDAGVARAKARTSGIRLQIIAIDDNARTEAQRELGTVETRLSELNDRRGAIEDRLARTEIRAPVSGVVNEVAVNTVGGVVTPAETLVTLVPEGARLDVEASLSPTDIDQVAVGQPTRLRFAAFNQRTTPELRGRVSYVSAASTIDSATKSVSYVVHVELAGEEVKRLGGLTLVPGMPVDVFVSTAERTALSYLSKPIVDQFAKAFKED